MSAALSPLAACGDSGGDGNGDGGALDGSLADVARDTAHDTTLDVADARAEPDARADAGADANADARADADATAHTDAGSDADADAAAPACGDAWSRAFGGDAGATVGLSIATKPSGHSVVVGSMSGSTPFDAYLLTSAGADDVFVAEIDPTGHVVWAQRARDATFQTPFAVAVDATASTVIAGGFQGSIGFGSSAPVVSVGSYDVFVAKLDAAGNSVWTRSFGSASTEDARAMAIDSQGNIAIAGPFEGTLAFGATTLAAVKQDGYVAKLDASGNALWALAITSASYESAEGVAFDSMGNVFVSGNLAASATIGATPLTGPGHFLVKLSPNGNVLWSKVFAVTGDATLARVRVTPDDHVILYGAFRNSVSFGGGTFNATASNTSGFVAKLDNLGQHEWSRGFDGASSALDLDVAASGALVATGIATGIVDFGGGPRAAAGGPDAFILRLAADGGHVSSAVFGDSHYESGNGIAVVPGCGLVVTGYFESTIDFGSGLMTSSGTTSAFVAHLLP